MITGSLINLATGFNIEETSTTYSTEEVGYEGAGCDNMFLESDNYKDSPANCCEPGTGYNLSCSIRCLSGPMITCGKDSDPGQHASLIDATCTVQS